MIIVKGTLDTFSSSSLSSESTSTSYPSWYDPTIIKDPYWTETQTITPFPIYVKPDLKVLNIKEKIIFYYWDNQILYYAIYKKDEKIEFKHTNDFLEVLNELGVFE